MRARRSMLLVVLALAAMTSRAAGEPVLHFKTPSTITTDGGSTRRLPPGYFLDEEKWTERDEQMKKLEEDSTRFKAENESLRKSASEYPFGWKTLSVAFSVGLVVGGAVALLK